MAVWSIIGKSFYFPVHYFRLSQCPPCFRGEKSRLTARLKTLFALSLYHSIKETGPVQLDEARSFVTIPALSVHAQVVLQAANGSAFQLLNALPGQPHLLPDLNEGHAFAAIETIMEPQNFFLAFGQQFDRLADA